MNKINLSIKTQLVLTFIAISTTIILGVTYFNFITNVKQEKNSFVQNSLIQANLLADFSVSALIFSDIEGANENLEKLRSDDNIQRVILFDNDGSIFSEYNPLNKTQKATINLNKVLFIKENDEFLDYGTLIISVPLKHNDYIYGTLYVEKSTKIIKNLLKKVFNEVIFFTIILLLVIYFISLILSDYLLKPILSLASTAEEIASSQNYSTRVEYNSKNEIGSLYKAFNTLVNDTENLTHNLEQKVALRTKELEESLEYLKQTQQKLIESEKMSALGNLVSGIAHEVNTPLGNAITGSSVIAKETLTLKKELEDGTLKRSTLEKRLNVLNDSSALLSKSLNFASGLIKSFKQISVDQVTNDVREFNIKEYIEEIFLTNHNKLKQIPTKIEIISEKELIVKHSPGVIAQIFNNLIQNSVIHGFENIKKEAMITVKIEKTNKNLILEYQDNGNGIDEKLKAKIFEPFVTTKRNAGGTGLGLNIVYNLVHQKLKGTLEVSSKKDMGTKFIIKIPENYSIEEIK